ncbi:beta-2 adrenergic receptor-like [Dendronephthya gigantea]|uniref:beta-2 adrenergic receptor-like n=1 Tax=Dendronephthya gigantea TaxID=151771 RepID=UPI00106D583D|nr:beta-2 adrenergic receptor-like [Dendronephthya gigantea]
MESNNNSTEYTTFERILSLTTANLAIADLLTGLVVDPLYAVYNFGIYQNKYYSKTLEIGDYGSYITVNNAIVTIVILIIDRSVAIKKPFLYRRVMTLNSAAIIVAISWIYSGFFSTFRLMGMSDETYILLDTHLHVTFSFLSLTLLFAFIYSNLKTQKRRRLKEVTSMENIDNTTREKLQEIKSDKRLLVTIFFILSLFFLTYSPYAVFIHLEFFCTSCSKSKFYYFLSKTSEPVVYLNSVLNPFIYAWRHKNFRKALGWVVKCRGRKRTNVREYGTNRETNTAEEPVVS